MENQDGIRKDNKEAYCGLIPAGQPNDSRVASDLSFGVNNMELIMAYTYQKGEFGIFPAKLLMGMAPNKQVILAWLIFRMNESGTCFPSVEKLCKDTGIKSRTTVTKCLKELEEDGYIKSHKRIRDDGGCSSNEYRVFIRRQGGVQELDTNHTNTNHNQLTNNVANAPCIESDPACQESSNQKPKAVEKKQSNGGDTPPAPKPRKQFTPPTQQEVITWAQKWAKDKSKSPTGVIQQAKEAFSYYDRLDWHDASGKKIKSWKMKIAAVWFKDDKIGCKKEPQRIDTF